MCDDYVCVYIRTLRYYNAECFVSFVSGFRFQPSRAIKTASVYRLSVTAIAVPSYEGHTQNYYYFIPYARRRSRLRLWQLIYRILYNIICSVSFSPRPFSAYALITSTRAWCVCVCVWALVREYNVQYTIRRLVCIEKRIKPRLLMYVHIYIQVFMCMCCRLIPNWFPRFYPAVRIIQFPIYGCSI